MAAARDILAVLIGACTLFVLLSGPAAAHAFGQRYDLPIPLAFYLAGAGAAVVVSFLVIGVFLGDRNWARTYPSLNLLHWRMGRLMAASSTLVAFKCLGVVLFALVVLTGLFGNQHPFRNLAPTTVWILWWVGFAYVSAFIGNLWQLINPWSSFYELAETHIARRRNVAEISPKWSLPPSVGVWPSAGALAVFAWFELVYPSPAVPRDIACAALAYSIYTWTCMYLFGRRQWLETGEVFAVYFGLLAKFAPFEIKASPGDARQACPAHRAESGSEIVGCFDCFVRVPTEHKTLELRPYAVGLLDISRVSISLVAFVLLALTTVLYDGLLTTPGWTLLERWWSATLGKSEWTALLLGTVGLVGFWVLFLGIYVLTAGVMRALTRAAVSTMDIARIFALSLVPIAIAYHFAHYLSFLVIQGQYIVPLVSDPFGWGWDLFGTLDYKVDIAVVGAKFAWYTAVIAIVIGHVIAVYLAHVQAVTTIPGRGPALRSQYPLTALMVVYTMVSLSILAEPIVAPRDDTLTADATGPPAQYDVPADALLPIAETGELRPVGEAVTAGTKLVYRVMVSSFHDGTETSVADLLYAFSFAYRWGGTSANRSTPRDDHVATASQLMRDQLVAIKVTGVDTVSRSIRLGPDLNLVREMPIIEIYLKGRPMGGESLAPPWSNVPWHVLALMEEMVVQGRAALSETDARRRGVEWLDLVRSEGAKRRMKTVVEDYRRQGFVPPTLRGLVSEDAARKRWAALAEFHARYGHFLVTNGPYILDYSAAPAFTLNVFRDLSYPLGVGSYDAYAHPRRAFIVGLDVGNGTVRLRAEQERVERRQRTIVTIRERVRIEPGARVPECKYLVTDTGRRVVLTGRCHVEPEGTFLVDLREKVPPGRYQVAFALYLGHNATRPAIRETVVTIGSGDR